MRSRVDDLSNALICNGSLCCCLPPVCSLSLSSCPRIVPRGRPLPSVSGSKSRGHRPGRHSADGLVSARKLRGGGHAAIAGDQPFGRPIFRRRALMVETDRPKAVPASSEALRRLLVAAIASSTWRRGATSAGGQPDKAQFAEMRVGQPGDAAERGSTGVEKPGAPGVVRRQVDPEKLHRRREEVGETPTGLVGGAARSEHDMPIGLGCEKDTHFVTLHSCAVRARGSTC